MSTLFDIILKDTLYMNLTLSSFSSTLRCVALASDDLSVSSHQRLCNFGTSRLDFVRSSPTIPKHHSWENEANIKTSLSAIRWCASVRGRWDFGCAGRCSSCGVVPQLPTNTPCTLSNNVIVIWIIHPPKNNSSQPGKHRSNTKRGGVSCPLSLKLAFFFFSRGKPFHAFHTFTQTTSPDLFELSGTGSEYNHLTWQSLNDDAIISNVSTQTA